MEKGDQKKLRPNKRYDENVSFILLLPLSLVRLYFAKICVIKIPSLLPCLQIVFSIVISFHAYMFFRHLFYQIRKYIVEEKLGINCSCWQECVCNLFAKKKVCLFNSLREIVGDYHVGRKECDIPFVVLDKQNEIGSFYDHKKFMAFHIREGRKKNCCLLFMTFQHFPITKWNNCFYLFSLSISLRQISNKKSLDFEICDKRLCMADVTIYKKNGDGTC